jgi:DNA-binding NarL/FixJ family response regulator
MKKVVLVQDRQVDLHIVEKLQDLFTVQCGEMNIELFYPPMILAQSPDLVIFDISADSANWVWRLEHLKRLSDDWGIKSPAIIVLSSYPSEEMERLVRVARADFFFPKSLDDGSLDVALRQVLS